MKFKVTYTNKHTLSSYRTLKWLYLKNSITRKLFYLYINRYEGGQFYSTTLRRIFKDMYDIEVGIGSYGCFTNNFRPHAKIGNYCSIAPGVQRLVGNHPMDMASMHPIFYDPAFGCVSKSRYNHHTLRIGNDVWIGVNAIITGNCEEIGDGAVIGAGAVVTRNVPPYAVVVGCPAKIIKYRFSEVEISKLQKSNWWKYNPDQLANAIELYQDIDTFSNFFETYPNEF